MYRRTVITSPVAVTFDFWDTLLHAPPADGARAHRRAQLLGLLGGLGIAVEEAAIDGALAEVQRVFDVHWHKNQQFHADDAVSVILSEVGVDPGEISAVDRDTLVRAVRRGRSDEAPPLTPNVAETLRTLKLAGVKLGIICDVGFAPSTVLRGHLQHHGVLDLFDHWSFSDEVGVYKPDPAIFRHALDGLGVTDPGAAVHVGDLRRTDVAGARGFGMTSVRYTGSNDDVPVPAEGDRARLGSSGIEPADRIEADHVISDHAELPPLLGIA
jgi:FMN phosphatase YigB (HAD superfamily)